jgi:hypothetical protein
MEDVMGPPKTTKLADNGTRYEYPAGTAEMHFMP